MTFDLPRRGLLKLLGLAPAAALPGGAPPARAARPPVRVLYTRVMGERYYDAATAFPYLAIDQLVVLRREPDNVYDKRAIEVFDIAGYKLGYVARIDNTAVARMIDAGERFVGRVARLEAPDEIRLVVDWVPG